jgi:hypothetical protein
VPWKRLIQIIFDKKAHIQGIGTIFHQFSVGIDVVEIPYEQHFEKHYRVDAFLTFRTIVMVRFFVKKS